MHLAVFWRVTRVDEVRIYFVQNAVERFAVMRSYRIVPCSFSAVHQIIMGKRRERISTVGIAEHGRSWWQCTEGKTESQDGNTKADTCYEFDKERFHAYCSKSTQMVA